MQNRCTFPDNLNLSETQKKSISIIKLLSLFCLFSIIFNYFLFIITFSLIKFRTFSQSRANKYVTTSVKEDGGEIALGS